MSKKLKIWLITGASLILIGAIIFLGAMTMLKWDFSKLSTVKFETNKYELSENFKDISISTKTADIHFVPSEDSRISVVCYEETKVKHSVSVKENALVIETVDTRKWYDYININFVTPKITVNIPAEKYGKLLISNSTGNAEVPKDFTFEEIEISESTGDVNCYASALGEIKIKTSTGNIKLKDVSSGGLKLTVSTGNIIAENSICNGNVILNSTTGDTTLSNLECENIESNGSTGNLILNNVIVKNKISAKRSTGDINIEKCDASELFLKTSTGNVKGSLLSDKIFFTESSTGDINVPKSTTGGKCEVTTSTGNITFTII